MFPDFCIPLPYFYMYNLWQFTNHHCSKPIVPRNHMSHTTFIATKINPFHSQWCRNVTNVEGAERVQRNFGLTLWGTCSPLTATLYAFFNSSRPEESIVAFSFVFREEMQILGKFSAQSWRSNCPLCPSRSYVPVCSPCSP